MVTLIHICFPSVVCRHSCFAVCVSGSSRLSSLQARGQTCPAGASPSVPQILESLLPHKQNVEKGPFCAAGCPGPCRGPAQSAAHRAKPAAGKGPGLARLCFGGGAGAVRAQRGHSCHLSRGTGVCHTPPAAPTGVTIPSATRGGWHVLCRSPARPECRSIPSARPHLCLSAAALLFNRKKKTQ